MFWSKIWFFLVAVVAVAALTVALVMPKPAQRVVEDLERRSLRQACATISILLEEDARQRVDLTSDFARRTEIVAAIDAANGYDKIDESRMKAARTVVEQVLGELKGGAHLPEWAMLIDRKGRVVTRFKIDESDASEVVAGRPLVDDALAGYLRDDIWLHGTTMFLVSAAPVIQISYEKEKTAYVGAVVLGHKFDAAFAKQLVGTLYTDTAGEGEGEKLPVGGLGFYLGDTTIAASKTVALDQQALRDTYGKLGKDMTLDCRQPAVDMRAGTEEYRAVISRLPGEASGQKAFYAVYALKPVDLGFQGTLKEVTKGDLGFGNFPWILVGGAFLLALGGGIALMLFEADRPLRRLTADAVRLAKGDTERLGEDAHPGKFGSIARSVNIAIDKLGRDAKSAKKDLDQLLGPAPSGSLGTIDLLATALPSVRPGGPGPAAPPPPSEFRFTDTGASSPSIPARPTPLPRPETPLPMPGLRTPTPPPIGATATPPPMPGLGASRPSVPGSPATPPFGAPSTPIGSFGSGSSSSGSIPISAQMSSPGLPSAPPSLGPSFGGPQTTAAGSPPLTLDDDILGSGSQPPMPAPDAGPRVDPYFKQVFDQFITMKKSCNEQTTGLTYEKFTEKLIKNRDDLMAKTGCRDVRFTVYVKDGKAALKATPVKDEG